MCILENIQMTRTTNCD